MHQSISPNGPWNAPNPNSNLPNQESKDSKVHKKADRGLSVGEGDFPALGAEPAKKTHVGEKVRLSELQYE